MKLIERCVRRRMTLMFQSVTSLSQYDDIGYSGKVININNNIKTVHMILLKKYEKVKRKFKWLVNKDNDWVEFDELSRR